jgi:hypothetical protein
MVRSVSGHEVLELTREKGWVLLDVRPPHEADKVGVTGAVHVSTEHPLGIHEAPIPCLLSYSCPPGYEPTWDAHSRGCCGVGTYLLGL